MLFAKVGDVGSGGLEDPKAEQAEHGHQRDVIRVRRLAGGGEQRLELQVGEPGRKAIRRGLRAADVLCG